MEPNDSRAYSSLGILDLSDSKLGHFTAVEDELNDTFLKIKQGTDTRALKNNLQFGFELSQIVSDENGTKERSHCVSLRQSEKPTSKEITSSTPKAKTSYQQMPITSRTEDGDTFSGRSTSFSKPMKKTLDFGNDTFGDLNHQKSMLGLTDVNSDMFLSGDCALNLLNEDEKEYNENHRFEIGRLSTVSTIMSNFSHVSSTQNDHYFQGRSEKLGSLQHQCDGARPSFGLLIKSPRNKTSVSTYGSSGFENEDLQRREYIQKQDSSDKQFKNNLPISAIERSTDCTTFKNSSADVQSMKPLLAMSSISQNVRQPLNVHVPTPFQNMSSCCYSAPSSFHYSWNDHSLGLGNFHPQLCQAPLYRAPFNGVSTLYNYPVTSTQEGNNRLIIPNELPEQVVCLNDSLEIDVPISNLSSESAICTLKVPHMSLLDSDAVKLDLMANSNFIIPELIEVKACITHTTKMKCSFKVPGKYRVFLEVATISSNFVPIRTAFTVKAEDAQIEMTSKEDGGSYLDFGSINLNNTITPLFIRIVNSGHATVPVKIAINSISNTCNNFIFPPELLSKIVNSSCHTWMDVLPSFLVVRIKGESTLDLPVTVDTGYPFQGSKEQLVASLQLLLKGNSFFRTKSLMKLCACITKSSIKPASSQAVKRAVLPRPKLPSTGSEKKDDPDDEREKESAKSKGAILTSTKRTIYFPGVEVGRTMEKSFTLMNKSNSTKLTVQVLSVSFGDQSMPFLIKDTNSECCKKLNLVFEPKQKIDIIIIFKPMAVIPFAGSVQVKVSTTTGNKLIDAGKQDFLIPVYGYGGSNEVVMVHPNPDSLRQGYLHITPLNKAANEFHISFANTGSRAAFVAILPMKDKQIELDKRVTLGSKAFVIAPSDTKEVKVTVTLSRFEEMLSFSQSFSIFCGDEQFRQILKSKIGSCNLKDRQMYAGFGLLKTLDILQFFEGEEVVPQDKLYKEFKKDVAEVFYESIKTYDVLLSTDDYLPPEKDDTFFAISNLACSYGSLLSSTLFQPDESIAPFGLSPPIRDAKLTEP